MPWHIGITPRQPRSSCGSTTIGLEIQNPGGLLPGLTLEQVLVGGQSRRRNPVIAEVLRQMGKMTTVGRGLVLIRQELAALGSPEPEFASDEQHFRVTLPSRHVKLR